MEIGKTFCGRTDGRTHLSSNLLSHRLGDDLKIDCTDIILSFMFDVSAVLLQNAFETTSPFTDA